MEQNKEKGMKTNQDSLIIEVPEGEERERKGLKKIFEEVTAKNFHNVGKEICTQVQKARRVPYRINPRRNTLKNILIKLKKMKDRKY